MCKVSLLKGWAFRSYRRLEIIPPACLLPEILWVHYPWRKLLPSLCLYLVLSGDKVSESTGTLGGGKWKSQKKKWEDGDENNHHLSQWPLNDHSFSLSVILQCQALGGAQGQSTCLTCTRSWAPSPALKKRKEIEARFCEGQRNGRPCVGSVPPLLDARPTVHK